MEGREAEHWSLALHEEINIVQSSENTCVKCGILNNPNFYWWTIPRVYKLIHTFTTLLFHFSSLFLCPFSKTVGFVFSRCSWNFLYILFCKPAARSAAVYCSLLNQPKKKKKGCIYCIFILLNRKSCHVPPGKLTTHAVVAGYHKRKGRLFLGPI